MKKIWSSLLLFTISSIGCICAAAEGVSPKTGQQISPVPYILGAVALVLLIALAVLSYINKKKK